MKTRWSSGLKPGSVAAARPSAFRGVSKYPGIKSPNVGKRLASGYPGFGSDTMEIVNCESCGTRFARDSDEAWKHLCFECWLRKRRQEEGTNHDAGRHRDTRRRKSWHDPGPEPAPAIVHYKEPLVSDLELRLRLPSLIRLCHPDKHGNSEAATEITQWLLKLRKKV
jgi:hypothetical protein